MMHVAMELLARERLDNAQREAAEARLARLASASGRGGARSLPRLPLPRFRRR
jgi:hypothetical protein